MIPIVIAFTPNYFVQASCLVSSVLRSSSASFEFICLVSEVIPQEQRDLLSGFASGRAVFKYITLDKLPEDVYVNPRYGEAAEYRLLLPELLPGYDKVIYVDCDVIVSNDLASLYDKLNLQDKLLAAVFEAPIGHQAEDWTALGCDSGKYFNSGFLVMNLAQMRVEHSSEKFIKELRREFLEFPDQDVLNIVCQGRVISLPPFWNGIRTFWLPQYESEFLAEYSESELEELRRHGTVHYTGGKPWNLLTVKFDLWWREYYSLPLQIQSYLRPGFKLSLLSRLYMTVPGKAVMEGIRTLYRKIFSCR